MISTSLYIIIYTLLLYIRLIYIILIFYYEILLHLHYIYVKVFQIYSKTFLRGSSEQNVFLQCCGANHDLRST